MCIADEILKINITTKINTFFSVGPILLHIASKQGSK